MGEVQFQLSETRTTLRSTWIYLWKSGSVYSTRQFRKYPLGSKKVLIMYSSHHLTSVNVSVREEDPKFEVSRRRNQRREAPSDKSSTI